VKIPSILRRNSGAPAEELARSHEPMDLPTIEAEAAKFNWYHSIELAPGYVTPGVSGPGSVPDWQEKYLIPSAKQLKGKTVLDIGTMNGAWAFEAEKRGASRVVTIDRDPTVPEDTRDAFNFAAKVLRSRVQYRIRSVYDLDPSDYGMFDFVFMFGVLYHLRYPFYGLFRAANVCRETFLLETHVTLNDNLSRPMMLFYPGADVANDLTTWWGPNPRCVDALMEVLGFTVEDRVTWEQPGGVTGGLEPARYTVRCRRVRPTPSSYMEM
jgi:tRNA (mo5U34)-methyltransferase